MAMTSIERARLEEAESLVAEALAARDVAVDELVDAHLAYYRALDALADLEQKS